MVDGSLLEPIPFRTAVDEGATHVLALRSRPAGYRKPAFTAIGEAFAVRDDRRLWELIRARQGTYNLDAALLEIGGRYDGAYLDQIAVPDHARLVKPLQANSERVAEALRHGASAMASAVLTEPVEETWRRGTTVP